jgi:hypothetical protein
LRSLSDVKANTSRKVSGLGWVLREFQPEVLFRIPDQEHGDEKPYDGVPDPQVEGLGPQAMGGG